MSLGPFGLDAIRALMAKRRGQAGPHAERLRRELEAQWPQGDNALEVLGEDPSLWGRWYEGARSVL